MGIALSKQDDHEMYRDAFEEAQRIIRISEEVRISLEKIPSAESTPELIGEDDSDSLTIEKLTSSKLAVKLGIKTQELLEQLTNKGFLELVDGKHKLTESGKVAGGEFKYSKRFGMYFLWPSELTF